LDAVHSDLSPNLFPCRREALILTPLPAKNIIPFPSPKRRGVGRGGKGLGVRFFALYFTQLRTAIGFITGFSVFRFGSLEIRAYHHRGI
jgi:hypothetical protein